MTKIQEYQEVFSEILRSNDVKIDLDKQSIICKEFSEYLESCGQFEFKPSAPKSQNHIIENLKCELSDARKEIESYRDSVRIRRGCTQVWVENGDVKYS